LIFPINNNFRLVKLETTYIFGLDISEICEKEAQDIFLYFLKAKSFK